MNSGHQVVLAAFEIALLFGFIAIIANLVVYIGLRRRGVRIESWRAGMPGYLSRLCIGLPPSASNARLAQIARWSNIALLFAFLGVVITGPLINQAPLP
jgi:hypothetical protein